MRATPKRIQHRKHDKAYRQRGTTISTVTLTSPSAQLAWDALYNRHDGSAKAALTEALLRAVPDTPGLPIERADLPPSVMDAWNVLWMSSATTEMQACRELPDGSLRIWSGDVSMTVKPGRWKWLAPHTLKA